MSEPARSLLSISNIEVIYDHVILVLKGVSLRVPEEGVVALLGANGAGKSTTLKAVSGLLRTERGEVTKGSIEFLGEAIHRKDPSEVVRRGIVQVMEGRHVFEHLTVEENLLAGGYTRRNGHSLKQDLEMVYTYFPRLRDRRSVRAGYISGGEQQMLAIGRALMGNPRLLILDEPSEGLAPLVVDALREQILALKAAGMTILMAEQNLILALALSERVYILDKGHVRFAGTVAEFEADKTLRDEYLAV